MGNDVRLREEIKNYWEIILHFMLTLVNEYYIVELEIRYRTVESESKI
ncbi:hypothetical protein ES703_28989 [subsurface metagenome]